MKQSYFLSCALLAWSAGGVFAVPIPPDKWATVRGQIVFGGEKIPDPIPFAVRNGGQRMLHQKWIVNPKNKGVKNVIVWISADEKDRGMRMANEMIHPDLRKVPTEPVEMVIDKMQFFPASLGIRNGQKLWFKNTSDEATNFRFEGKGDFMNVLVAPGKEHTIAGLKANPMPIRMSSNIHPWMESYARVFEHPYFAVTDEDGKFEIRLVPVGRLRLFLWHPESGFRDGAKGMKGDPIYVRSRGLEVGKIPIKPAP